MTRTNKLNLIASVAVIALAVGGMRAAVSMEDSIDVLQYHVIMSIDLERATIEGTTHITFKAPSRGATSIRLSRNNLAIHEVLVGKRSTAARLEDDAIVIDMPADIRRGTRSTLTIKYGGKPARGLVIQERSAYTSYFTCDWMMCALDDFGDKASFRLELLTPSGTIVYGPGKLLKKARESAGIERQVWYEARPYSSYVYGFALGEFVRADAQVGRTKLIYLSTQSSAERLQRLFAPTADMLRFFETKAGVPFPHPTYVQVHVAGASAREALNFSIIGEDAIGPMVENPQEDWVIAHEAAHQWWGNGVTCADLSHFWLNEGITTFMVAAWKEHRWGREAYERELELLRARVARAKSESADHPLTYDGKYASLSLRRAIQYSKGALFMDRLRTEVGDDVFWRALKQYTRTHMGGTANSQDLQRTFERAANRSLGKLFDEWVY
jgi:aminopeptidase N